MSIIVGQYFLLIYQEDIAIRGHFLYEHQIAQQTWQLHYYKVICQLVKEKRGQTYTETYDSWWDSWSFFTLLLCSSFICVLFVLKRKAWRAETCNFEIPCDTRNAAGYMHVVCTDVRFIKWQTCIFKILLLDHVGFSLIFSPIIITVKKRWCSFENSAGYFISPICK